MLVMLFPILVFPTLVMMRLDRGGVEDVMGFGVRGEEVGGGLGVGFEGSVVGDGEVRGLV